jgi:hypothetical protein
VNGVTYVTAFLLTANGKPPDTSVLTVPLKSRTANVTEFEAYDRGRDEFSGRVLEGKMC